MTMTPEEKFNNNVWWILQEIKKEKLLTPKEEKVHFSLRKLPKTSSVKKISTYGIPPLETQRKLLYKLKEWGILELQPTGFFISDISDATEYFLTIYQPKFNEIYQKYEKKYNYRLDDITQNKTSEQIILNYIILGLFRDDEFHNLNDKEKKEFYIDILDELLANDIKTKLLFKKEIDDKEDITNLDYFKKEISKIEKTYINKTKDKLKELEKNNWFKIEKINIESFNKGLDPEVLFKNEIISEGKLLTHIIKITIKEISWDKIIEYIASEYEKNNLDWDNIYSSDKQEFLLMQKIYERSKFLDKDTDIIFLLDKSNSDWGKIQTLKTLKELEHKDFIHINGFKIYDPEDYIHKLMKKVIQISDNTSFALKAKISTTPKFKEKIKKDIDEATKFLKPKQPEKGRKLLITKATLIPIKNATLDEKNYLLEINNGEKIISFKSKKKGKGLEKETKLFKILYHLWDYRWIHKNNKVIKKGDYISLDNLAKNCESTEAAYKHIQRLNDRFKDEGVAIEIRGENEKYRLIVNKL